MKRLEFMLLAMCMLLMITPAIAAENDVLGVRSTFTSGPNTADSCIKVENQDHTSQEIKDTSLMAVEKFIGIH